MAMSYAGNSGSTEQIFEFSGIVAPADTVLNFKGIVTPD
jgi:hypothetical protein